MIDFAYININNLLANEEAYADIVPLAKVEDIDYVAWECFLHSLSKDELEVLVCLALGMTSKEIVCALHFANHQRLYNVSVKLRNAYRKQKQALFAV